MTGLHGLKTKQTGNPIKIYASILIISAVEVAVDSWGSEAHNRAGPLDDFSKPLRYATLMFDGPLYPLRYRYGLKFTATLTR